jgi:hypothetical protein
VTGVFTGAMLIALIRNLAIMLLILWRKERRSCTNIAIACIAAGDACSSVIVTVNAIGRELFYNYILGETTCLYLTYFKDVSSTIPDYLLVVLCYRTKEKIKMQDRIQFKERWKYSSIILIMAIGFAANGIKLHNYNCYKVREWKDFTETWCQLSDRDPFTEITVSLLCLWIPIGLLSLFDFILIVKLKLLKRNLEADGVDAHIMRRQEFKIMLMLSFNLVINLLIWTPEQFVYFYDPVLVRKKVSDKVVTACLS